MLEPYSYSRDVAYIVVAPDNEAILPRVRTFFKELSTAYEICKLGRHSPITKVLRDGILRVGKTAKQKIGSEPVEEWFTLLGEGEISDMLKLYAQVRKKILACKDLLLTKSTSNETVFFYLSLKTIFFKQANVATRKCQMICDTPIKQ